ncbi:GTP-binding protein [Mycolicibacterium sp.]|uniref:CobW family GTP-binding protein n=1 Tax=Mycolicibacterium sp. TaxID=2320850 RepID=UPI0028A6044A|nr:GTP-binding protein [Mycolicibacterium sp.]
MNLPLTVIGGYLGAGKTTLLNHLLRNNNGLRIAALVNDFGDINIDADLIESVDGETIVLTNGCACCTLADGLTTVLAALRERAEDFDHILIECSGVADPLKIGQIGAAFGFPLAGVTVVVDAELVRTQSTDKYVGGTVIRQLASADLLIVNKSDLVAPSELESLQAWLADTAPDTPGLTTQGGRVDPAILLDSLRVSDTSATPAGSHDSFDSWSFRTDAPLRRSDLEAFLTALPPGVVRAKGILRLADDTTNEYLLQKVGRRTSLVPLKAVSAEDPTDTRLVVIGVPGSIDGELFAQRLGVVG